ncbi:MAG: hypothetical protein J6Y82_05755 [Bacteroidales bacterium]|nr:hypothetical protein [Bacteroidales bacterium]
MEITIAIIIGFLSIVAVVLIFMRGERRRQQEHYRDKTLQTILPNRLQAYERLTLYVERIRPESMIPREQMSVNTTFELHSMLINNIKLELEHNIAMQVYISSASWQRILRARDEVQNLLTKVAKETNPKASSLEYGRKVLERSKDECSFYIDRAIEGLRRDIDGLFINN